MLNKNEVLSAIVTAMDLLALGLPGFDCCLGCRCFLCHVPKAPLRVRGCELPFFC